MEHARFECHGHVLMDGDDFTAARDRHHSGVDDAHVRQVLSALREKNVVYFRDGGDALGVSLRARKLAGEYGIELRSPAFAIHKKGRYGSIVGRSWQDLTEYRERIRQARDSGADFIKLMFSGILTFQSWGELSCPSLTEEEIRELIHVAHGEGFAVMAHVNGAEAIRAAAEAGVDSVEHGYFADRTALDAMAKAGTIWVPTLAAVAAFDGRKGFAAPVVEETMSRQLEAIRLGVSLGVPIAPGSDSGAVGVPHGEGIKTEYALLARAGLTEDALCRNAGLLARRFRRG